MPRERTYSDASKAIGETPMIQINRLGPDGGATVFAKCEFFQPLNSVKDRIGVAMIEAGERDGKITKDNTLRSKAQLTLYRKMVKCFCKNLKLPF